MAFILVPVVVIVLLALMAAGLYNGLVRGRNGCDAAWADVDVELRRRNDLVPNLVETVKGYAAHERGGRRRAPGATLRSQAVSRPRFVGGSP